MAITQSEDDPRFYYYDTQKTFILTHVKLLFLLQPLYNLGLEVYVTLQLKAN